MAHTWITQAPLVTKTALETFTHLAVLPQLVYRDAEADFAGKAGTVVNVKRPTPDVPTNDFTMSASTRVITAQNVTESSFALTIDTNRGSAVDLSDEELTFTVEDFTRQVLLPQVRGLVKAISADLATHMVTATNAGQLTLATDGSDFLAKVTAARKFLNNNDVPDDDRVLLVGADVEELALNLSILTEVDKSGSPEALRNATIGRLRGFNVVLSKDLPADVAIAMHRTAFSLVTRAPAVPDGVVYGASLASDSIAMRHMKDYDSAALVNRSILNTYYGIDSILDGGTMKRAIQLDIT